MLAIYDRLQGSKGAHPGQLEQDIQNMLDIWPGGYFRLVVMTNDGQGDGVIGEMTASKVGPAT